ncbi:hypothetical protein B484DRAFT_339463 [Ochromonadaceae sp. CCMP2298]|nr:hypothetical protein B484DRAFT_339463 [Ochromonadaceae sp. CCMP2298]
MLLLVLLGLLGLLSVGALSSPSSKHPVRVAVAGAGSGVGLITFKKLLSRRRFSPIAIVSNKQEYKALKKLGAADEQIRICDITQKATLAGVFGGAEKVVICSAAAPKRRLAFRIKNFFRGLVGRHKPPLAADLFYEKGRRPYEVDYLGQRNVVDECLRSRVGHVVLLGSMGGECYRGSRLNLIGRSAGDDLRNGNTLKWKRSSERYLMKRCYFTILHAAQLVDARGGPREVIWDTDDALLRTVYTKISREDAAEAVVQALMWKEAIGRSIDIASKSVRASDIAQGPLPPRGRIR